MRLLLSILLVGGLMSFQLIGAGSDLNSTQTQMNKNILELKNNETTTIFKDDTGTRRVLLGKGADGFYGVKVSEAGKDVYSASDDELVFNSGQNVFKIVQTGEITVTHAASSTQDKVEINHGLSYTPAYLAFTVTEDGYYQQAPYTLFKSSGVDVGKTYVAYDAYVNDTVFGCRVSTNSVSSRFADTYDVIFKYYLLQESAN